MRLNIRTKNNYSYYTIIKDYTNFLSFAVTYSLNVIQGLLL